MAKVLLAADSQILLPRLRKIISGIPHVDLVTDITGEDQIISSPDLADADVLIVFFPDRGSSAIQFVPLLREANPSAIIITLTTGFDELNERAWRVAGATYAFNLTIQLQQFIDCLATYARIGLVHDRPQSNGDVPSNRPNKQEDI